MRDEDLFEVTSKGIPPMSPESEKSSASVIVPDVLFGDELFWYLRKRTNLKDYSFSEKRTKEGLIIIGMTKKIGDQTFGVVPLIKIGAKSLIKKPALEDLLVEASEKIEIKIKQNENID